jgi:hypothetical protein
VELLVGVLGSYTVEGSRTGGSEGSFGGAVSVGGGSWTGERVRERRGLEVGERAAEAFNLEERAGGEEWMREGEAGCGTAPLAAGAVVVVMLSLRE